MGLVSWLPYGSFAENPDGRSPYVPLAQVVGDDLLVTNPKRVKQGIDGKWCNALLLKVNQIGSLTESINAVRLLLDLIKNLKRVQIKYH